MSTFGRGIQIFNNSPGGGGYALPIASDTILGGIKVGDGLEIDPGTGVLSVVFPPPEAFAENGLYVAPDGVTVRMGVNPLIEDTDIDIRDGFRFSIRNTLEAKGPNIACKQFSGAGTMTFSLQNDAFGGKTFGMSVDGDTNGNTSKWGDGVSTGFTFTKGLICSTNPGFLPIGIYVVDQDNAGFTSQDDFMPSQSGTFDFKTEKLQYVQRSGVPALIKYCNLPGVTGNQTITTFDLPADQDYVLQLNAGMLITAFVGPVELELDYTDTAGNPITKSVLTGTSETSFEGNTITFRAQQGSTVTLRCNDDLGSTYDIFGAFCWLNPIP